MMNRIVLFLLILVAITACNEKSTVAVEEDVIEVETPVEVKKPAEIDAPAEIEKAAISSDSIIPPQGFTKVDDVKGDLDKDGIAEKIVVYNTSVEGDLGFEREIHIYKKEKGNWALWYSCAGPVMPSKAGGVTGEPFEGVHVTKGCIVFYHYGGSTTKWGYTHRFRYQHKKWELIGATITDGISCGYWNTTDYNLSTGNVEATRETETCFDDGRKTKRDRIVETFVRKLRQLPEMSGFSPGENDIKMGKASEWFYY